MKFVKLSSYFLGLILLSLMSVNTFAQAQKKTEPKIDTIYGPMNYGLDRQDAWEFNEIRFRNEIDRIFREKEAKIKAIAQQMKNCRTSECRAPLHQKIREIERKVQFDLAALSEDNQKRIEWINKYWDEQDKKPQKRRKYFP
ncbi:MAG TPA: hypothetical protein PKY82_01120 [Pyrinomonadaceae bacterium]|nr:hypothetical protein [Pyrinomonadaceae bacterium]